MRKTILSLILVVAMTVYLCHPAIAAVTWNAPIGASVAGTGILSVTIRDRITEAPGATSIGFNAGAPINQTVSPDWLLADQMLHVDYDSNEPSWAIIMVTNNTAQFPGIEYQYSINRTARWSAGMIRAADDIYNRARIAWQIYLLPTPTSALDDDHIYGVDANNDGDFDDPGDIMPEWSIVSDKGDSTYAGWDANNDGDYLDPGLDANNNGDYSDEGDIPPDVVPNPISAAYWIVQGTGGTNFLMPYPDDGNRIGTGTAYVYLGADLGGTIASGDYNATIYVELIFM